MKAARRTTKAIIGKAEGRRFWRWPLALSLALAVMISLFHDLPAFAGRGRPKSHIGDGRILRRAPPSKRPTRRLPDMGVIAFAI